MVRLFVSRLLLLLIVTGAAALYGSFMGVERAERWGMDGDAYAVSAFPAADAWASMEEVLDSPGSGAAGTSTSPEVIALTGVPARDVLGPDDVGVVTSTSPLAARAAAGDLRWPGVTRFEMRNLHGLPGPIASTMLLVPSLLADSSSLSGVIVGTPEEVVALRTAFEHTGVTSQLTELPPVWRGALTRTVHLPVLLVLGGFALFGAQIVWHTTVRAQRARAVQSRRVVGASAASAACREGQPLAAPWAAAAVVAALTWLLLWPAWDREIGITADTALLWTGILTIDAGLAAATVLGTLWSRKVTA